jgi:predicted aspartyl protease
MLEVFVGVSKPREEALIRAAQTVPPPVLVRLLVDTGASGTVIDPAVISKLNLSPTGMVTIHTPSTGTTPHQISHVSLVIPHQALTRTFFALPIGECSLRAQGIDGLLGRDVLAHCLFIYAGPDNAYILSI